MNEWMNVSIGTRLFKFVFCFLRYEHEKNNKSSCHTDISGTTREGHVPFSPPVFLAPFRAPFGQKYQCWSLSYKALPLAASCFTSRQLSVFICQMYVLNSKGLGRLKASTLASLLSVYMSDASYWNNECKWDFYRTRHRVDAQSQLSISLSHILSEVLPRPFSCLLAFLR